MRRIVAAVARGDDPESVFDLLADELTDLLGADLGITWRFDDSSARVAGSSSASEAARGAALPVVGDGAVARVRRSGRPELVTYARLEPGDVAAVHASVRGYRSGCAAPLHAGGRLWGVLHAVSRREAMTDSDATRLADLAEIAGLAVASVSDRTLLRRRVEESEAFGRVASVVAQGASRDEVLQLVAREVAGLLGLEVGGVGRYAAGRCELVASWAGPGVDLRLGSLPPAIPLDSDTVVSRVYRSGRAARIDDYRDLVDPVARTVARMPMLSSVAAPVVVDGALWGVVSATSPRAGAIEPDAEARLGRFAELVGIAVANAEQRASLELRASSDPLTGLPNRRAFGERLERELRLARRHAGSCALVLFDIDHFKRINDRHGHPVGDVVLREVAQRLAGQSRPGDLVARIGGEEFAWIVSRADETTAWRAAERARSAVAMSPISTVGVVAVSAGIAGSREDDDAHALLLRADRALYLAKEAGRATAVRYSEAVPPAGGELTASA